MVRTSRRRLLAVGGLAALAGCLTDDTDDDASVDNRDDEESDGEDDTDTSAPELLGMIPREIDGNSVSNVQYSEPIDSEAEIPNVAFQQGIIEELELDGDAVDGILFAIYGDLATQEDGGGLWMISGSFDADAPALDEDEEATAALVREDGFFLAAFQFEGSNDDSWDSAVDAVEATRESEDDSVLEEDSVATVLEPVAAFDAITLAFEAPYSGWYSGVRPRSDAEGFDTLAIGTDVVEERTVETTYAALFESVDVVDKSAVTAQMQMLYGRGLDADVSQDEALVVASAVHEIPTEPDRDASPDARFNVEYSDSEGTATIYHRRGEPVDTAELTVLVEDEPANVSWDGSTVEEGDTTEITVEPLEFVRIEWRDPDNENIFDELGNGMAVDSSVFDADFDVQAGEVRIEYDGQRLTETDRLIVETRSRGDDYSEREQETVSERHSTLDAGDTIVLSDIGFGDRVRLRAEYGAGPGGASEHIARVHPRPPGRFHYNQAEQQIVFHGAEDEAEPTNYQVLVGGQPASTQFADEYDTLDSEETLSVDADAGDAIVVEWTGTGGPSPMLEEVVLPPAEFEFSRSGEQYRLEYVAEEPWPADEFEIATRGSDSFGSQFADEHDTLEQGDGVEFDLGEDEYIQVHWNGPNDEHRLFSTSIYRTARFDLGNEDGTVQLVFEGSGTWPADAFEIRLNEQSLGTPFAEPYDSLESGDAIALEDAQLGDNVTVTLAGEDESRRMFSGTVEPADGFSLEEIDGGVEITYESAQSIDADQLDVMLYGENTDPGQVDPWGTTGTVDSGETVSVEVDEEVIAVVIRLGDEHIDWIELDRD